jgi:hypothetical protein
MTERSQMTPRWPTREWFAKRLFVYSSVALAGGIAFVIGAAIWKVVIHG